MEKAHKDNKTGQKKEADKNSSAKPDITDALKPRTEKENIKRKKKWMIFFGLILLIIIPAVMYVGHKVMFVIEDELNLQLKPASQSIFLNRGGEFAAKVEVVNDNFQNCKAACEFELVGLSNSTIIEKSFALLDHNEKKEFSFSLKAPESGEGQIIFNFNAKCINQKAILCQTDSIARQETALIIMNYGLTDEEKSAKQVAKPALEDWISWQFRTQAEMQKSIAVASAIPDNIVEKQPISQKNGLYSESIAAINARMEGMISAWNAEEYLKLLQIGEERFSQENAGSLPLIAKALQENTDEALSLVSLVNENQALALKLKEERDEIAGLAEISAFELNKENAAAIQSAVGYSGMLSAMIAKRLAGENISEKALNIALSNHSSLDELYRIAARRELAGKISMEFYAGIFAAKNHTLSEVQQSSWEDELAAYNGSHACFNAMHDLETARKESKKADDLRQANYNWSMNITLFDNTIKAAQLSTEIMSLAKAKENLALDNSVKQWEAWLAIGNSSPGINTTIESMMRQRQESLAKLNASWYPGMSTQWDTPESEAEPANYSPVVMSGSDFLKLSPVSLSVAESLAEQYCLDLNFSAAAGHQFTDSGAIISQLLSNAVVFAGQGRIEPEIPAQDFNISLTLQDDPPQCCVFGECRACCEQGECKSQIPVPVIFIHGHMFNKDNTPEHSMQIFGRIQLKLAQDGFINAGRLDLAEKIGERELGNLGRAMLPASIKASYYYIKDYGVGDLSVSTQKSERIENYALRLADIVNLVKQRTGASKVNIVAHSMGGLVAREYINIYGTQNVEKVIMVNTPNHGVTGNVYSSCKVLGAKSECDDMKEDSIFLRRLNARPLPEAVQFYNIYSTGCSMGNTTGDGIVTKESAYLEGAENFLVEGQCTDALKTSLHGDVLDPSLYPKTYELLLNALQG